MNATIQTTNPPTAPQPPKRRFHWPSALQFGLSVLAILLLWTYAFFTLVAELMNAGGTISIGSDVGQLSSGGSPYISIFGIAFAGLLLIPSAFFSLARLLGWQIDLPGWVNKAGQAFQAVAILAAFIVIAVQNGGNDGKGSERGLEYDTMSDRLARFINDEVLPAVLGNAEIKAVYPNIAFTDNPWGRAAMGCSSGGAAAIFSMEEAEEPPGAAGLVLPSTPGSEKETILEAIQSLPQEQQDALRMRYVENLPSKEIADRLDADIVL